MSRRIPLAVTTAAVAAASLAMPAGALAGISVPLPPPSAAFSAGDTQARGPVVPAEDINGNLVLCREDEEQQMSICIPWPS